jgi:hypothetical protein
VEAISSTLSTLPMLAPDLFGEVASRKNRIQNYCEQDYPTSCGRLDPATDGSNLGRIPTVPQTNKGRSRPVEWV